MTLMWTEVVALAKAKRNETEEQFRAVLDSRGVKSANVTNWKGSGKLPPRPIPVARYPLLAELLGVSIDELHKRKPAGRQSTLVYPNSDDDAKVLAGEISRLPPGAREIITALVHMFVGQKVRDDKAARSGRSAPPVGKGKPGQRPEA